MQIKSKVVFLTIILGLVLANSSYSQANEQYSSQTSKQDEKISISGVREETTTECDGKTVTVSGTSNIVTLIGNCPRVIVSGVSNQISIEKTDRITVSGSGNNITYKSAIKAKYARISKSGVNNKVTKE